MSEVLGIEKDTMKPIPLSALPADVQKRVCAQAGIAVPAKASSGHARTVALKDLPGTWGFCKRHGMAYAPKKIGCAMCDEKEARKCHLR